MTNSLLASVALSFAKGLGAKGYWRLTEVFGSPEEVLKFPPAELQFRTGLQTRQVEGILPKILLEQASFELEKLSSHHIKAFIPADPEYSALLKEIPDPPPVIYAQGDFSLLNTISVAVVGSRASTSYGRRVATTISRDLAVAGVSVVSGLALGIDAQAHEGALAGGGKTIAVLGCGLDVVYPWQNRKLYEKIKIDGLLVSDYPFGTKPDAFRFPARNRIISGVSRGVLVVEAAKKSGSLITAQLAVDFNRDVFAVPGQVDSVKSEGAHWLLQQGAKLVQSVEDVLEELPVIDYEVDTGIADEVAADNQNGVAKQILSLLDSYPVNKEDLLIQLDLPAGLAAELFLTLELEGFIEILPGDLVRRI